MASINTKISKGIVLVLMLAVIGVALKYTFKSESREAVRYSTLECLRTLCIENKVTGDLCSVAEPRVSEILIESDPNNPNIRNIRIIPSDDRCQ